MISQAVDNKILYSHTDAAFILRSQCESSSALSVHVQVTRHQCTHTQTGGSQSITTKQIQILSLCLEG